MHVCVRAHVEVNIAYTDSFCWRLLMSGAAFGPLIVSVSEPLPALCSIATSPADYMIWLVIGNRIFGVPLFLSFNSLACISLSSYHNRL